LFFSRLLFSAALYSRNMLVVEVGQVAVGQPAALMGRILPTIPFPASVFPVVFRALI
jgi:hypothetical protein